MRGLLLGRLEELVHQRRAELVAVDVRDVPGPHFLRHLPDAGLVAEENESPASDRAWPNCGSRSSESSPYGR